MLVQRGNQILGGAVEHALGRKPSAVGVLPDIPGHIADEIVPVKQGFQIGNQLLCRIPSVRRGIGCKAVAVLGDGVIPVHNPIFKAWCPTTLFCHLYDGAALDGSGATTEGAPFPLTFAGTVSAVGTAPIVPNRPVKSLGMEGHAHIHPFLV